MVLDNNFTNMNEKFFLIAIGGTGMRCLESFVHLCAAGLFDNHTIDILTLDTDQTNGNKKRVENLINLYNSVKTDDGTELGGNATTNTFFSAKLKLYRFFTDYSNASRNTLLSLTQTNGLTEQLRQENQDLSDLFFERDSVQGFSLDHGYRAQTHLGAMLMYHGIIESARKARIGGEDVAFQDKELANFLQELNKHAANARVFVFGSVFGGTGASSIPVIPIALSEALRALTGGTAVINLNKALFGSTLLTDYFTFGNPTDEALKKEKVIATSNHFALNSQAALSFYNNDTTVQSTYKRMYHIGWPSSLKNNYGNDNKVLTGGSEQENPCHVIEMMCATAAYDFFNDNREKLSQIKIAEYVHRTVEVDDSGTMKLNGASFVGEKEGNFFENKLGAFLSFAHIVLSKFQGAKESIDGVSELLNYLDEVKFQNYNNINDNQCKQINDYLKEFAYKFINDKVAFGWIYQLNSSMGNGKFIFSQEAFKSNITELLKIDPGTIFADEMHHWDKSGFIGSAADKRFNTFVTNIKKDVNYPNDNQGATLKEQFLAHMYNTITETQHFINY